ncbi:MAG TPA: hypothetical protein VE912_09225, partial [Bacteroidales bacterium]|nr:hypothetical protein [Bacteroidales bacterium]
MESKKLIHINKSGFKQGESIIIPYPKFRELEASYSAKLISDECKIKSLVHIHGKNYVSIGAMYNYNKCLSIKAYECIPLAAYSGDSMTYMEH